MTEFELYFTSILDGKIVACEKMKRVSEMLMNRFACPEEFHFDTEIASRHTDFIEQFCKLPTGKIGTPLKLELFQKARLQALFGFVDDNDLRQYNECIIVEGRKNGKALSVETEIPTPNGFKKMMDVNIGDFVIGSDGKPHKVNVVSEIFKNHECYKVTFDDGSFLVADSDHLWSVKNKKNKIVTRKTKQLLHFKRTRKDGKGTEYLYRVPMPKPISYDNALLPIDPYTLGVWIGDGSSSDTRITVSENDIDETRANIAKMGHTTKIYINKDRAPAIGVDVCGKGKKNKMLEALRTLGVLNNKHIPDIYMHSSINQRFELLKGLMDTDGYCSKTGQCEFCQKDMKLVMQVSELLSSLSIKNTVCKKTIMCNGKKCVAYYCRFFTDKNNSCFKILRKHNRLKECLSERNRWKGIRDICKVDSVDCKCISIDSKDHLYCAGRNYTLTHNTTETAAVEIDMLVNDNEGSPQIYNIATMLDQAKLGFTAAHKMIKQSPMLSKHIKKRAADLYFALNMGYIKALASNSNSLDGLDVHCGVIDELAAIKNRDIYDLIKQAMGARMQPLLFCITTNGFVRNGIFDSQYNYATDVLYGRTENNRFLPFIYELDDPKEWDDESCWIKANPGIDTIKSREYLRQMVDKAKDDPSFKPTVLVKDFNIPQTSESAWLAYETLNNEEKVPDYHFRYAIGGMDAADSVDLNAAKAICMRPNDPHIYVKSMYWLPERIIDEYENDGNRRGRDSAPYTLWRDQGLLRAVHGARVDKKVFLDWFCELRDEQDLYISYIGYDPWHIDDSLLREFKAEFGEHCMIPVRQGVATLSQPMKNMEADLKDKLIVYDNNPIDKWCLINTSVKADINGNIQPVKGLDKTQRIDGTLALIDAYVVLENKRDEYLSII